MTTENLQTKALTPTKPRKQPRQIARRPGQTEVLPPHDSRPYLNESSIVEGEFSDALRREQAEIDRLGAEIIQIQDQLSADIKALEARANAEIQGRHQRRDDRIRIAKGYQAGLDAMAATTIEHQGEPS